MSFRDNQILTDKNTKLKSKETSLDSMVAQLKTELHSITTEKGLTDSENNSLMQEVHILKKNLHHALAFTF